MLSEPGVTRPWTCICWMLCHGPKRNLPERPAMTHRNEPPELVAVNPSWEVVPGSPSTTPPPRTAGPDEAATDGAKVINAVMSKMGAKRRRTRATAIGASWVGGVAEGPPWPADVPYSPAAGARCSVDGRATRLGAANGGKYGRRGASSQPELRHSVSVRNGISGEQLEESLWTQARDPCRTSRISTGTDSAPVSDLNPSDGGADCWRPASSG